jgi:amino acid transporter
MAEGVVKTNGEKLISKETGKLKRGLTLLPLFGLMYFTVSGGSFGIEPLISASGPGLALLLIIITPIIFSLPNVLMVRELSTMMPAEGGYYHWVKKAFGPFMGFMAGWNNWVVSWLDVTIYPVLAATYLGYFIPALKNGMTLGGMDLSADFLRWVVSALIIWAISALQVRGARLSGLFTNWLGVFMLTPLIIMSVMGIIVWARSGGQPVSLPFMPEGQDFTGALSTGLFVVMWNYMGWELPSAAGDEIVNPRKTYPRAMALVLIAAVATYALPVVAGLYGGAGADGRWQLWGLEASDETVGIVGDLAGGAPADGATPDEIAAYDAGTADWTAKLTSWDTDPASATGWEFPQIGHAIGKILGGSGLATLMGSILTISAVLSMVGLFIGNSLGGTRVPFALAEDGMFPRWLVRVHSKYGTPWVAIVLCGVIFTIFSWQAFAFLVVADVFMQSLVILAEFAAMWRLRVTHPHVPAQRVPGGILGMVLVTLGPTVIIAVAIISQYVEEGFNSIGWALALMAVGAILYFPFRKWLKPGVPDVDPFEVSAEEGAEG